MKEKISVCLISYNAEKTIIEALDSILKQTYGPEWIALIISDDASTDRTGEIVDRWLIEHRTKFDSVLFLKQKVNRGIVKNINIVYRSVQTSWVKPLAGDDLLLPECVTRNMQYISENPEVKVVFSRARVFCVDATNKLSIVGVSPGRSEDLYYQADAKKQFEYLYLRGNFISAPTTFISKEALELIGYVDADFSVLDDYVMWFDLTKGGISLPLLDTETVLYRVHARGASFVGEERLSNPFVFREKQCVIRKKVYPTLSFCYRRIDSLGYVLTQFVLFLSKNQKNAISEFFIRLFQFRRSYL